MTDTEHSKPENSVPQRSQRAAIVIALLVSVEFTIVFIWPNSRFAVWLVGITICFTFTYAVVSWFREENKFWRATVGLLALAATSGGVPTVSAHFQWTPNTFGTLIIESSSLFTFACLVAATIFAFLHFLQQRPQKTSFSSWTSVILWCLSPIAVAITAILFRNGKNETQYKTLSNTTVSNSPGAIVGSNIGGNVTIVPFTFDVDAAREGFRQEIETITKEKIKQLKAGGASWREIVEIEEQRTRALALLGELSDSIERTFEESTNSISTEAIRVLSNEGAGEAIAYLESQVGEINSQAELANSQITNDKERLEVHLEPYLLKAELHQGRFEWDQADEILRRTVSLAPHWWKPHNRIGVQSIILGKWEEAKEELRISQELASDQESRLLVLNNQAALFHLRGDFLRAEKLFREVFSEAEHLFGRQHPNTLETLASLGVVLAAKGEYVKAEPILRRAAEGQEAVLGKEHPKTLGTLASLASVLDTKGDFAEAEELSRRILEFKRSALGEEHPSTLVSMNNLSTLLQDLGNDTEAEKLCRTTLEARKRILGDTHPETLVSVNNLASLLQSKGDLTDAELLFRNAFQGSEEVLGKNHPDTLVGGINLACVLHAKGDLDEAETLFRQALADCEEVLGDDHPHTLACLNNLAMLLKDKGELAEAETLMRRSLDSTEHLLGSEHPSYHAAASNLALILNLKGDVEEAERIARSSVVATIRLSTEIGRPHSQLSKILGTYLECLKNLKLPESEANNRIASLGSEAGLSKEEWLLLVEQMKSMSP